MLIASCVSIQIGAALATTTFSAATPLGAAGWRFLLAAVILVVAVRPRLRSWTRQRWRVVAAFGVAIAANEVCLYLALSRLPLGMAVTLEFLGPLTLSLTQARQLRHTACALAALIGVMLLCATRLSDELPGIIAAICAAVGWAAYILASSRAGAFERPRDSLTVAVVVSAVLTLPFAVTIPSTALSPRTLGVLLGVAFLGTVAPYALELAALRRLPAATAGVLFSIEPAIGALVGFVALGQHLDATQLIGIFAVICAGAVALHDAPV